MVNCMGLGAVSVRALLLACLIQVSVHAAASVPELSFQDLRSLYPKSKPVFDWGWPKTKIVGNRFDKAVPGGF